ncbi:MAG: oligogalacturonate lyase family protein [Thermoguttaceae bacterium]
MKKMDHREASMSRRPFLRNLSLLAGGAAPAGTAPPVGTAGAAHTDPKSQGGRGSVRRVAGEITESKDTETGVRVRRLTADGSDNVHLYFSSGKFQFHLLDIGAGQLVQLTDGEDLSPTMACLDPAGRLFYFEGPALRAVKLDTLEDRELYRVPEGTQPALPTCTADGRYVAFAYSERRGLSTETGRIYSTMAERYYQHPSCVVMRIDTTSGEAVAAWGERAWISHVLIHPLRPDLILFCHEGGSYVSQRMWTVDLSATRGREAKPLYPQRPGEFCVHEYFTRQGEIGFQYELEREGRMESYNCFVRADGTWIRQYLLPGRRPGHIQSNSDNSLVVGDCGYLGPDDQEGGNYMSLILHVEGRAHVRRLCRRVPGSTQHSHGHPVFSLDDQWVLYNSMSGTTNQISMADVTTLG